MTDLVVIFAFVGAWRGVLGGVVSSSAAGTIMDGGVHVEEGFAPPRLIQDLRYDVEELKNAGRFLPAGADDGATRVASYCDPVDRNRTLGDWPAFFALWERLDMVRSQLREEMGLDLLEDVELHYVDYPTGGFYQRHLDETVAGLTKRAIAFICYITPKDWTRGDGGALRVFSGRQHFDVQPEPGRLVLFDAATVHHEVRPTMRSRRTCLVGWFHVKCDGDCVKSHLPSGWRDSL